MNKCNRFGTRRQLFQKIISYKFCFRYHFFDSLTNDIKKWLSVFFLEKLNNSAEQLQFDEIFN